MLKTQKLQIFAVLGILTWLCTIVTTYFNNNYGKNVIVNNKVNLSLMVIFLTFIGITGTGINDAYGIAISTVIANDPDDGDTVYSVGDTITITFGAATNATAGGTMTQAEYAANFTTTTSDIDVNGDITGFWTSTSILTMTVISIASVADPPIVDTDSIIYVPGDGTLHAAGGGVEVDAGGATITGDFGVLAIALTTGKDGSSGCRGDCSAPTLGVDEQFTRVVENGFTYNGDTINVERYFTPYPLITVDVGKQNKAVFKIYDNSGPDNIRHFDLAFGLDIGQTMGTSNAMIVWNKSTDGTETVTLVDPHNALDKVRVLTSEGKCKADSTTNDCLIVTVFHTFRESLDFDIVGTNVWDFRLNAWQNFYNHGIHIEGQSLNPPDEYVGIYKGNLIHLIETGKNTAVDTDGNTWTFDNTWIKDYISIGKIDDPITSQGYDRNHVKYNTYKQGQELVASSLFETYYKTSVSQEPAFSEIDDIKFYEFPETIDKKFDPVLLAKMHEEDIRAQKYLEEMFAKMYPGLIYD